MAKADLTPERLREVLNYDPETGVFTWKVTNSRRRVEGSRAGGSTAARGYIRIGVDGTVYTAHRLAWLYVFGCWPSQDTDHINRDRADNRIANLRDVSRSTNLHNKGNVRGYFFCKRTRRWVAQIKVSRKVFPLGRFGTEEEARDAYLKAKHSLP